MWAEGPYLHAFANLGRPPFSNGPLVGLTPVASLELALELIA